MNWHLLLGALLAACSMSLPARAQEPTGTPGATAVPALPLPDAVLGPADAEPPLRYRLANGLQVSLQRDPRQPRVAISVAYHVGGGDDPPGFRGLAHLVEHLMFEGMTDRVGSDYFELIEAAGTTAVNGMTSPDETLYFHELPRAHLELGLWLEASRMAYLLKWIDLQDLERARAAVLNEWEMRVGSSGTAFMHAIIAETIHPEGHPYHHEHDNPEDIAAIKLGDVQWFFQQWYGPGNASLAVVGDFDVKAAQSMIETMFGPVVRANPTPKQRHPKSRELHGQHEVEIAWASQVRSCSSVWPVPPDADEHDRALDVLAVHLSLELRKLLASHERLLRASAWYGEHQRAGDMTVQWLVDEGSDGEEERGAIEAALAKVRVTRLTEAQLVRARDTFRASYLFGREQLAERSLALASRQDGAGSWDREEMAVRFNAVTSEQVLAAAQRFLPVDRRLVACASYRYGAPGTGKLRRTRLVPVRSVK